LIYQRSCDGDALSLSARQFIWPVRHAVSKIDCCQCLFGHFVTLGSTNTTVDQRQLDVVQGGCSCQEVERLKDEPNFLITDSSELVVVHLRHVLTGKPIFALTWRVETANQIHQRRLARTRRTNDRDVLAFANIERNAVERVH
jgi:hypothetical protein